MARLVSLNVGMPTDVQWQGRTVHTGIVKNPVLGPRLVRRLNVDGDGQGDLGGHGGEMRAVLVYQVDSYEHWRTFLNRPDIAYGDLGENFTVAGLPDDEVHIGDRFQIGDAAFEVTQPRVTCYRAGLRIGEPRMPALLVSEHRPGFYLRVLREGVVQAGDEVVRTAVGRHRLSVAAVDALLYLPDRDAALLEKAVDIPALSPGWRQSFRDLLDAEQRGEKGPRHPIGQEPGWIGFRTVAVSRVEVESETVKSFYLRSVDDHSLAAFVAGQFISLRVTTPAGAMIRNYSLSQGPSSSEYRISVKRDGVASTALHNELSVGGTLDVASPRGEFTLRPGAGPVVLASAGIGVTPVLAILESLAAERSARDVWWLHTARSPVEHPFADRVAELLASLANQHSIIAYTDPTVKPPEGGRSGRFTMEDLKALPMDADAYLCGPSAFMDDIQSMLTVLGMARVNIHTERFGALDAINPGIVPAASVMPHRPSGQPGSGPTVTFVRSGLSVAWRDDFGSLLELAEACDVPTQWSCRVGVCHTCETSLVSGEISYRTEPLELPAADRALTCCAVPTTDVVVEL